MNLIVSVAVGVLFAAGSYLLLQRDFIKVVGGTMLITHSVNLFIMASGLSRGAEPIYPLVPGQAVSDPLVQAMVLTAIVISFGVSALLISLIYRVYVAHRSVDIEHISDFEERLVQQEEQEVPPEPGIGVLPDREDGEADDRAPDGSSQQSAVSRQSPAAGSQRSAARTSEGTQNESPSPLHRAKESAIPGFFGENVALHTGPPLSEQRNAAI